jgi:hypothetical protein
MELGQDAKKGVRELGDAINGAVEKSKQVADAIEFLRKIGYEPNLTLKLEIGLQEIGKDEDFAEEINDAAFSYANRRFDFDGTAAGSKCCAHDDSSARRRAWRNAESAYQFDGRSAFAAN